MTCFSSHPVKPSGIVTTIKPRFTDMHLIITDSLLCFPWGKKPLHFSIFNPLKACLHGGGGPQVGEVTRLGGVTRLFV